MVMEINLGDVVSFPYGGKDYAGSITKIDVCGENKSAIMTSLEIGYGPYIINYSSSSGWYYYTVDHLIKIINKQKLINNTMSLKETFTTLFLQEPEKSFRKAGVTNGDGFLTEDGQKIFVAWLLQKNGSSFKTEVVDGIIAEQDKK